MMRDPVSCLVLCAFAILVTPSGLAADDVADALSSLRESAPIAATEIAKNAGLRFFLLERGTLGREQFRKEYDACGLAGRLRMLLLLRGENPAKMKSNFLYKIIDDEKRSVEERYMAGLIALDLAWFYDSYRVDHKGRVHVNGRRATLMREYAEERVSKIDVEPQLRATILAVYRGDPFSTEGDRRARAAIVVRRMIEELPSSGFAGMIAKNEVAIASDVVHLAAQKHREKKLAAGKFFSCLWKIGSREEALKYARIHILQACLEGAGNHVTMIFANYGEGEDLALIDSVLPSVSELDRWGFLFARIQIQGRARAATDPRR